MLNSQIENAKRNLTGQVKVKFRDGLIMFVNISDIAIQSNRRVRVGGQRFSQFAISKIEILIEIFGSHIICCC